MDATLDGLQNPLMPLFTMIDSSSEQPIWRGANRAMTREKKLGSEGLESFKTAEVLCH